MVPLLAGGELLVNLLRGPLTKVVESYVSDLELRRKIEADLEQALLAAAVKGQELGAGIVSEEIRSEHLLTWAWRPVLMLTFTSFLLVTGMVLPIADMIAGHVLPYEPRWASLPPGFWDFLSIGMGGYIGGRTLEKVAGQVFQASGRAGAKPKKSLL